MSSSELPSLSDERLEPCELCFFMVLGFSLADDAADFGGLDVIRRRTLLSSLASSSSLELSESSADFLLLVLAL